MRNICEDDEGNIIFVSLKIGIIVYYLKEETLEQILYQESPMSVYNIVKGKNNDFWFVDNNKGLLKFNSVNKTIVRYNSNNQLINTRIISISSLLFDSSEVLWIGTNGYGLYKYSPYNNWFSTFKNDQNDKIKLNVSSIRAIFSEDSILWIGGYSNIDKINRKTGEVLHYSSEKPLAGYVNSILTYGAVYKIIADIESPDRYLWIGTEGAGIDRLDKYTNTIKNYRVADLKNKNGDKPNLIYDIIDIGNGYMWVVTGTGLCKFNKSTGEFKHFNKEKFDIGVIQDLFIDKNNLMWLGTVNNGLYSYNFVTEKLKHFKNDPNDLTSISSNLIKNIFEDKKGNFWIGTSGGGLNKMDRKNLTFENFTVKDGLLNNVIYGILEDSKNNLWLSTNKGVSMFNTTTLEFVNYTVEYGLQDNEFNRAAYFKDQNGEMFFGGINGVNAFFPKKMIENKNSPEIVFTDFRIFNKSISIGEKNNKRLLLHKSITETKEIRLKHSVRNFTFEFAALDFAAPNKNEYKYLLVGIENDWINLGNTNYISFYTLPPNEYTLKIKASNNNGVWNEEGISIKLIILPPYWKTWWFRISSVIFTVACIGCFYLIRIKTIKKRNKELEKQVLERTIDLSDANTQLEENQAELEIKQEEILSQRDLLHIRNVEIEQQNSKIKGSIRYAKTIQNAILPSVNTINKHFENFIIFRPKDIVSGDFYKYTYIRGYHFLMVVDCTGHGIPGAFMSMIGNSLLNEIINEKGIFDPTQILTLLNKGVISALQQYQTDNIDGMDVCLCRIEKKGTVKVLFSGARRDLIYYSVSKKQIEIIKGKRKSIGGDPESENSTNFENHELTLNKGDILYLTTDGYVDQNNNERKRFSLKGFIELLKRNARKPLSEQKTILEKSLEKWQQNAKQRDDITVLGIKL